MIHIGNILSLYVSVQHLESISEASCWPLRQVVLCVCVFYLQCSVAEVCTLGSVV